MPLYLLQEGVRRVSLVRMRQLLLNGIPVGNRVRNVLGRYSLVAKVV